MRFVITPSANPVVGLVTYTIVATAIHGDGTTGAVKQLQVVHDEPLDQWQSEAGHPRQP